MTIFDYETPKPRVIRDEDLKSETLTAYVERVSWCTWGCTLYFDIICPKEMLYAEYPDCLDRLVEDYVKHGYVFDTSEFKELGGHTIDEYDRWNSR